MNYCKIESIDPLKESEVWDITFAERDDFYQNEANFIAQNIVVHNSHAAGVVISPAPLSTIAPLHVTRGTDADKVIATQFNMSDVESLGLIKLDVLGLSTKTAIALAVQEIKDMHGVDVDIGNLPLSDEKTLRLLSSGKTDGCFQLENTGMKQALQQIGIHAFNDLVVTVAMYRPGPKDYIPEYSRRKRGERQVKYPHETVRDITSSTYGIMVFQEQVMRVFMSMADLTASEGYTFMKGCAKKKKELIAKFKDKFKRGSLKKGVSESVVDSVWSDMEKFGGYAFNRAHACVYAYESFKTAYLKAHYRLEFMSARLTVESVRRNFDGVEKYENDCRKSNIKILPPDLNKSKLKYTVVDDESIRRPLLIKGVGDKAAEDIVKNQPYRGSDLFRAFSMKIGPSVNTKVIEALHAAKLFGSLKKKEMLATFERIKTARKRSKGQHTRDLF